MIEWPIRPMKAVPAELPTSDAWAFEPKWDGHRALVRVRGGRVAVLSSNGIEKLATWPWIADIGQCLTDGADDLVLDGEVVAMDDAGRHRFEYIGDARRAHALILFDILGLRGASLVRQPFSRRRALLEEVVSPVGRFSITPVHADGALLWDVVVAAGYEGVVSKRLDSAYVPGRRSPNWRKTKARLVQEFVVGGWLPGSGRRDGALGSLLLGVYDDGALRFVGAVGSGFDDRGLDVARAKLARVVTSRCPFEPPPPKIVSRKATWAEPQLVVQVEYAEWTGAGQLRHPVFLGFRDDVDPATVTARP